ncbi:MAG: hypothetical protein ACR2NP_21585, partial [Pirellulaceae bacterium]
QAAQLSQSPGGRVFAYEYQPQGWQAAETTMNQIWNVWCQPASILRWVDMDRPSFHNDAQIIVESIEPGVTVTDPWTIKYRAEFEQHPVNNENIELSLDPNNGFRILESISSRDDQPVWHSRYLTKEMAGRPVMVYQETTRDGEDPYTTTIRELHENEIGAIKMEVENVANRGPEPEPVEWRKRILSPLGLAIAWPGLVLIFLGIDQVGERVKIRVQPDRKTTTESD